MVDSSAESIPVESHPENAHPAKVMGGFSASVHLLAFDRIREQLASYTHTLMGREAALSLTPSLDLLEIATRQQETAEARHFQEGGGALEFGPADDFRQLINRGVLGGLLGGVELNSIQGLLEAARFDRTNLARHEETPLLFSIGQNLPDLRHLEHAIRSAISPAGEVLDDASPALRQLRQESRSARQRLDGVMERNLRRWQRQEVVQEPIITQRNGRMVLLIRAEMRSRVPGIVHDVSDSGATVFIEPMPAIEPGNRWRELRLAEDREVERVLRQISRLVGDAGDDLLLILDLLARLDLDMAKGRYAASLQATAPAVLEETGDGRRLRLTGARHPLLTGEVVPVSLELAEGQGLMLITGPNAGGKTVALKTIGLLVLMSQAGLHVPAEEAVLPWFDGVYTDIGDQQSIEQSLSTFSSHIHNLLGIMETATENSLVLVDELGTSTDPEEGSALAKAILSYFQHRGVRLVATTHHRGVARYVQEQPGMVNASVDLHPQTLEPTYRVTMGLPGRSYALTIAARLGLPPDVIDQARDSLSPTDRATEDLLGELQVERQLVDGLRREAESALVLAKQQQAELESRLESFESAKVEVVEETRQELLARISDLLDQFQQAERTLDQNAGRQDFTEQRIQLREAARKINSPNWQPIEVQRIPWETRLNSGDRVYIRGIDRAVEVITPPDEQGRVEVLLGTMRATIPVYQLQRPAEGHPPAAQHRVHYSRSSNRRADPEIDIRGLRVDEAMDRLEGTLNAAALDGVSPVRVIHGKGTGALRRAVRDYLEGHPLVATVAPGEGPGGDGVTVVEIQ